MVDCPYCSESRNWRLADGRRKCRGCRQRFSEPSVWHSFRISTAKKTLLVERFVFGIPVHRQRLRPAASAPTVERFYRALRAYCLLQVGRRGSDSAPGPFIVVSSQGSFLVGSTLYTGNERLPDDIDPEQSRYSVHGVKVVSASGDESTAGAFMAFCNHWSEIWQLNRRRSPDLVLAEICWRFDNRERDIFTSLVNGLKKTSRREISRVLRT